MADCLTLWTTSYRGTDFHRPWNLCSDEPSFTDDEGKEVTGTSLLDDLAEAKRHSSADDVDNDVDADCISLWDDVFDEQWTTKDSNSGPTLAELNGGELTDLEQYEPLHIGKAATKRKRSRSIMTGAFRQSSRSLTVPLQICDEASSLQTVQENSIVTDRSSTVETELQHDKEESVSHREPQGVKVVLSLTKPNRKVCRKFVKSMQLKNVSLPHQQTEDSQNVCGTSSNRSDHTLTCGLKHSRKLDTSPSAHQFHARKKMKAHHAGSVLFFISRTCCYNFWVRSTFRTIVYLSVALLAGVWLTLYRNCVCLSICLSVCVLCVIIYC